MSAQHSTGEKRRFDLESDQFAYLRDAKRNKQTAKDLLQEKRQASGSGTIDQDPAWNTNEDGNSDWGGDEYLIGPSDRRDFDGSEITDDLFNNNDEVNEVNEVDPVLALERLQEAFNNLTNDPAFDFWVNSNNQADLDQEAEEDQLENDHGGDEAEANPSQDDESSGTPLIFPSFDPGSGLPTFPESTIESLARLVKTIGEGGSLEKLLGDVDEASKKIIENHLYRVYKNAIKALKAWFLRELKINFDEQRKYLDAFILALLKGDLFAHATHYYEEPGASRLAEYSLNIRAALGRFFTAVDKSALLYRSVVKWAISLGRDLPTERPPFGQMPECINGEYKAIPVPQADGPIAQAPDLTSTSKKERERLRVEEVISKAAPAMTVAQRKLDPRFENAYSETYWRYHYINDVSTTLCRSFCRSLPPAIVTRLVPASRARDGTKEDAPLSGANRRSKKDIPLKSSFIAFNIAIGRLALISMMGSSACQTAWADDRASFVRTLNGQYLFRVPTGSWLERATLERFSLRKFIEDICTAVSKGNSGETAIHKLLKETDFSVVSGSYHYGLVPNKGPQSHIGQARVHVVPTKQQLDSIQNDTSWDYLLPPDFTLRESSDKQSLTVKYAVPTNSKPSRGQAKGPAQEVLPEAVVAPVSSSLPTTSTLSAASHRSSPPPPHRPPPKRRPPRNRPPPPSPAPQLQLQHHRQGLLSGPFNFPMSMQRVRTQPAVTGPTSFKFPLSEGSQVLDSVVVPSQYGGNRSAVYVSSSPMTMASNRLSQSMDSDEILGSSGSGVSTPTQATASSAAASSSTATGSPSFDFSTTSFPY